MKFQYDLSPNTKKIWNKIPSIITTMLIQMSVIALAFLIYTKFLSDPSAIREFYTLHGKMYTRSHAGSIILSCVILVGIIEIFKKINDRAEKKTAWIDSATERVLEEISKTFLLFGAVFILAALKLVFDQFLLTQYLEMMKSMLLFCLLPFIAILVIVAWYEVFVLIQPHK